MKSKIEINSNNLNNDYNKLQKDQNEKIINSLKHKIKSIKTETKKTGFAHSEEIKQKNESQQLLQKCIEDLKFDINKIQKDINNFSKKNILK